MRPDDRRLRRRPAIERVLDRLPVGSQSECWIWPGARRRAARKATNPTLIGESCGV